jgi:hypothetical protein
METEQDCGKNQNETTKPNLLNGPNRQCCHSIALSDCTMLFVSVFACPVL